MDIKRTLKVKEFSRKEDLLDFVNEHSSKLKVVSISSSQEAFFFRHFLWYYDQ